MRAVSGIQMTTIMKELGIGKGDTVLVHSSLSGMGNVQGGPDAVIDAFMVVLGVEGTLVMPAFSDNMKEPFDPAGSRSDVGIITEIFRKRSGVLRSLYPTHSVCACGKNAQVITEGHHLSQTPCGRDTPFFKIKEMKGKVVLLGVDMNRNTLLHAVEEEAGMKYLVDRIELPAPTYMENYREKTFAIKKFPSGHRDFLKITPMLREKRLMKEAFIGLALTRVFEVEKVFDFVYDTIRKDPEFFLCDNPCCNSCMAAKRKIRGTAFSSAGYYNKCLSDNCEICVVQEVEQHV